MKKLTYITAATICIVLSSGTATAEKISKKAAKRLAAVAASEAKIPEGYTRLTGDKLLDFIADSTVSGLSVNFPDWSYHVYRAPNGKQRGTSTNGGDKSKDSGKWTIDGDSYCSKWRKWADGKKICYHIYTGATEDYYSITTKGKLWSSKQFKAKRVKGNTKNL